MPASPAERPLTSKQQRFVHAYLSNGGNGRAAAAEAGYKGSDQTLRSVASENLAKPNIRAAIDRAWKHGAEDAAVTASKVLRDIERVRAKAEEEGRFHAALRASQMQGNYIGMFKPREERLAGLEDASSSELVAALTEILGAETEGERDYLAKIVERNAANGGGDADRSGAEKAVGQGSP